MIDAARSIGTISPPKKKKVGTVSQIVAERRESILSLTKRRAMGAPFIAKKLDLDARIIRADIRWLIEKGLMVNNGLGKDVFVKAIRQSF